MKKILFWAAIGLMSVGLASCDDFLDAENYTEANTSNYPASPADLNKELAALYGVMNQFSTSPLETPWFVWNIMSDDSNGAGGTGDVEAHAVGHLMTNKESLYANAWHNTYVGISRANAIIFAVDAFDWTGNEKTRNQLLGEAYFMRGLFYLWGVQFWGDIPAYWASAAPDPCPQVSAKDVIMPHILADFVTAYNLMSNGATTWGDGHATKGAAAGMLARAYMFYQGFYLKAGELASASLSPVAIAEFGQEGADADLTKDFVVKALEDCITNSGARLVDDYRLLWQYTNELTAVDYAFTADLAEAGRFWAGNGNSEELFGIQYTNAQSWNGSIGMGFCNQGELYCALRCDANEAGAENGGPETLPYAQGWGMAVFNYNSVTEWPNSDPRKKATVLDCEAELQNFAYTTSCSEETGYYNKKWTAITCSQSTWNDHNDAYIWWGVWSKLYGGKPSNNENSMQGDHYADVVLLRLSDVMLMHSELTGTATYLNQVQTRAGVANTGYSLKAIQDERRWELFGEGIRFNDLRRWSGIDGGEGCLAAQALQKQEGSKVNYTGRWTVMSWNGNGSSSWAKRYAETNGFIQIPTSQINIIANPEVLKQNAGWDANSSTWNMSGTPVYN